MSIADTPDTPNRRANDERIPRLETRVQTLHESVEALKGRVDENTEITKQVRDILGTFRVTLVIAKWIAAVVGMVTAIKMGWNEWTR